MSRFYKHFFSLIIFLIFIVSHSNAQENKPLVINFYKEDYRADNKNWAIGQDDMGYMYFANDAGLLEFDGVEWTLSKTPNSQVVRSVGVHKNQIVFTGSYEDFGRWDRDISGKLCYTSLSDGIDKSKLKNSDFWKIVVMDSLVYFQSFSSIFVYDFKQVRQIDDKSIFLFLSEVNGELLVPKLNGEIFKIEGYNLIEIKKNNHFEDTEIRFILPYNETKYLIGTSTKGIYILDNGQVTVFNTKLNDILMKYDLNCGVLSSKGIYYFGTILGGIFQVDAAGDIKNNISTHNSLQNNTILSLYENKDSGGIWAALDRGISYIDNETNIDFFINPLENIGSTYTASEWMDYVLLGTNQGVFYTTKEDLYEEKNSSNFKLIEGTQGQVWSLSIIDGRLYCSHNRGLKEITKDLEMKDIYLSKGIYNVTQDPISRKLYMSSYHSILVYNPQVAEIFNLDDLPEPIIYTTVDHLGNIWAEHANRGVYKCRVVPNSRNIEVQSYYGGNKGDGLPYKLKIFKMGGRVELLGDNTFYIYDDVNNKIVENAVLNKCFKNIRDLRNISQISSGLFWAISKTSIYKFRYNAYEAEILESYDVGKSSLSLVNTFENISTINDSISLVCLDNGFLLYYNNKKREVSDELPIPQVRSIQSSEGKGNVFSLRVDTDRISFPYVNNTVRFNFSAKNVFIDNLSFRYRLIGLDTIWSASQKINNVSFPRLAPGKYTFEIESVDNVGFNSQSQTIAFEIRDPWYNTYWAYLVYILVIAVSLYMIWTFILRKYRNLHLQEIRRRETTRLRNLTHKLQEEVVSKNAEILTQTSFIIKKNEILQSALDIINEFCEKNESKTLLSLQRQISVFIKKNMDSEEDWKMFLFKFEEKHANFFKHIKATYPDLTASDLRLCACLKLNLETKEIASLMSLSVRAVENSRYRLRKKLNLKSNQNLNEFFITVD